MVAASIEWRARCEYLQDIAGQQPPSKPAWLVALRSHGWWSVLLVWAVTLL